MEAMLTLLFALGTPLAMRHFLRSRAQWDDDVKRRRLERKRARAHNRKAQSSVPRATRIIRH